VRGVLEPSEAWGDLRAPLRVASTHPLRVEVDPDGQTTHTRLQVVRAGPSRSEVRIEAVTGRAHQLRVHLAHLGHPIVGDPAYDPETLPGERMRLHAEELWIPAEVAGSRDDVVVRASELPFPVTPPG
jgi:23S rRNA-/tRNA-specific pseudouridylate synthase